jgi:hypothetical protein
MISIDTEHLSAGWRREAYLRGHIAKADGSGRGDIAVFGLLASDVRRWDREVSARQS